MKKPFLYLVTVVVFGALVIAACGSKATPAPAPTDVPAASSVQAEAPTEAPAAQETGDETTGDTGSETGGEPTAEAAPADAVQLDENGVPSDVPVPDAAYDLRVEANHTRISFKVDGTIQDVVAFFQENVPALGWNKTLGADSAIGAMGTLGRQNDALDKLSINMSFNPNGNFVSVTVDVIRAP